MTDADIYSDFYHWRCGSVVMWSRINMSGTWNHCRVLVCAVSVSFSLSLLCFLLVCSVFPGLRHHAQLLFSLSHCLYCSENQFSSCVFFCFTSCFPFLFFVIVCCVTCVWQPCISLSRIISLSSLVLHQLPVLRVPCGCLTVVIGFFQKLEALEKSRLRFSPKFS